MYTAADARQGRQENWDRRIREAVEDGGYGHATIRVYAEHGEQYAVKAELEKRGFINVEVPDMVIKGDVYFEWNS